MKNEDNQCFKWAVTRALNPVKKNPQRVTEKLERQAEGLNWDGIRFPTPCEERMYKKFEENNDNVSLLVFGQVGLGEDLRIISSVCSKGTRGKDCSHIFLQGG